jgi:hypothetical protein
MSGERQPLYGIRYKDGDGEPFSILAEADVYTDGTSPSSTIHQTVSATICVGALHRRTLFLTHDFELVGSLVLFGTGTDFEETFYLNDFKEPLHVKAIDGQEIEVFDMLSGEVVVVSFDDPCLADVIEANRPED